MKITFHHPPALDKHGNKSNNPFNDFVPANKQHYPTTKGIYIYGLKLKVNGIDKFVPFYVGISYGKDSTLLKRLYTDHYTKNKTGGKGKKELWDFTNPSSTKQLSNIYSELFYYDYINNYRNVVGKNTKQFRRSEAYIKELLNFNYLLYFNNKNYFEMKNGKAYKNYHETQREIDHWSSLIKYPGKKITRIKALFSTNFYYIYCPFEDIEKQIPKNEIKVTTKELLERIELTTKLALKNINIHTTAAAKGNCIDLDIDFTNIQEHLVNMGSHPHNKKGDYDKLIIQIRK
ncbi:MAG: hypothetical protein ACKOX3_07150 [Bacteroidota bacterium]